MTELPKVTVGHMDLHTGREVRDGDAGTIYAWACGVRVRINVDRLAGEPIMNIVVDPHWTEDEHVNALAVNEIRAHDSQAALRVRGVDAS